MEALNTVERFIFVIFVKREQVMVSLNLRELKFRGNTNFRDTN